MIFKEYKFEIIVGSVLSIASMYLFYQLFTIKPRRINPADKISFEMIRPHSDLVNEFTLDGREVDSRFVNPFVKKDLNNSDKKSGNQANLVPVQNKKPIKDNDKAKKEDKKKTGIEVKVVSKDRERSLMDEPVGNYNPPLSSIKSGKSANTTNNNKSAEKKILTENKKRNLSGFVDLLVEPKAERVAELVAAVKNKEIEMAELHDFVGKMLRSGKSNVQSVGIYLAYYIPTFEGFEVVAVNQDALNPEVKAYSEQFLTSFTQPTKLPLLAQALQSEDIKVVVKAGEVILSGLDKIKSGQAIDYGGRSNRGNNEVKSASVLGYFLPIAEILRSSQNQTIASVGNALSQQLSSFGATP